MLTGSYKTPNFDIFIHLTLIGESVPVSKTPLTDDALKYLDLSTPSIHPHVAKHFLFSGTKVIRARRPQNVDDDEAVALAIVMRTGFLTTKGALVRSMLFPKPSGFKFYRDSFRYIAVMGMVALLGFIASFINFVRLGVSQCPNRRPPLFWQLTQRNTARLAFDHNSSPRSDHDCCPASSPSHTNHWNQFCAFTAEKTEHILYQPTEVSGRT